MILYIHGFGGYSSGKKAKLFKAYFQNKNIKFIAPNLPNIPNLAIENLEDFINIYERKVSLVGSSLGGYYAMYLANKYNLKVALINPSIFPTATLHRYVPLAINYFDNSTYEWNENHINRLKDYEVISPNQENILLFLQKGDETLNYLEALNKLPFAKSVVEEGGSHSFEGIEKYFELIEKFFNETND